MNHYTNLIYKNLISIFHENIPSRVKDLCLKFLKLRILSEIFYAHYSSYMYNMFIIITTMYIIIVAI